MPLSEEIAVLDGLEIPSSYKARGVFDPSMGGNRAGGSSWDPRMPLTPSNAGLAGNADEDLQQAYQRAILSSYNAGRVFDPSSGANYKGGSSWDPRMPLTPPHADLARADLEQAYFKATGKSKAISNYYEPGAQFSPSAGANTTGGSSWDPSMPLTPTQAGLASVPDLDLAQVYSKGMRSLKNIPSYYNPGPQFDPTAGANMKGGSSWDPSMPLTPTQAGLSGTYEGHKLTEIEKYYGSTLTAGPAAYGMGPQFDPTAGANYKGGSSWNPTMPLTPSNAGLAELMAVEPRDGVWDKIFKSKLYTSQIPAFQRLASQAKVAGVKKAGITALQQGNVNKAELLGRLLQKIRAMRRSILAAKLTPAQIARYKAARA